LSPVQRPQQLPQVLQLPQAPQLPQVLQVLQVPQVPQVHLVQRAHPALREHPVHPVHPVHLAHLAHLVPLARPVRAAPQARVGRRDPLADHPRRVNHLRLPRTQTKDRRQETPSLEATAHRVVVVQEVSNDRLEDHLDVTDRRRATDARPSRELALAGMERGGLGHGSSFRDDGMGYSNAIPNVH
jgi:hypothetical protein